MKPDRSEADLKSKQATIEQKVNYLTEKIKVDYENQISNLRSQLHDLAAQLLDQASSHAGNYASGQGTGAAFSDSGHPAIKRLNQNLEFQAKFQEQLDGLRNKHAIDLKQLQLEAEQKDRKVEALQHQVLELQQINENLHTQVQQAVAKAQDRDLQI